MNRDEFPDALDDLIPPRPTTSGWGARARRRHRARRVGAVATVGVAMVAAVVALATAVQLGQPTVHTTPVPADPATMTAPPEPTAPPLVACAARVEYDQTVAALEDAVRGAICGPVASDPSTHLQIMLTDALVADIVAEITSTDTMFGIQPGISPMVEPSLVLVDEEGETLTLIGDPDHGYSWYPPPGSGGLHQWRPSPDIAARLWDEITGGGCTAPERMATADVPVHVYSAGGDADAVARVVAHLEAAGFPVTDTGETAFKSLGGPLILRGGHDHGPRMEVVASWFGGSGGGEMSRTDEIVDVLVTDEFTPEALREGLADVSIGHFTCPLPETSPSTSPDPAPTVDGALLPYDNTEVQPVLEAMAPYLRYDELEQLTATLSRTDHGTAKALAPGFLGGGGPDDLPVLVLRLEGPVHPEFMAGGDAAGVKTGALIVLDPSGQQTFTQFLFDDETPGPPGIDPAETDVEELDLLGRSTSALRAESRCSAAWDEFVAGNVGTPPDGGLREDPNAVWVCFTGLLEARHMPYGMGRGELFGTDAQGAVDLYNALPTAAGACSATPAGEGFLVYEYSPHERYVVQVLNDDCGSVVAGDDQRRGGEEFRRALKALADN